jgi:hypothetical protein
LHLRELRHATYAGGRPPPSHKGQHNAVAKVQELQMAEPVPDFGGANNEDPDGDDLS